MAKFRKTLSSGIYILLSLEKQTDLFSLLSLCSLFSFSFLFFLSSFFSFRISWLRPVVRSWKSFVRLIVGPFRSVVEIAPAGQFSFVEIPNPFPFSLSFFVLSLFLPFSFSLFLFSSVVASAGRSFVGKFREANYRASSVGRGQSFVRGNSESQFRIPIYIIPNF